MQIDRHQQKKIDSDESSESNDSDDSDDSDQDNCYYSCLLNVNKVV
ncbi:hypothetical protein pb186bvf_017878 [Paramecium bursaria]